MIIHHFRLNYSVYSMVFSQIRFGARHPTLQGVRKLLLSATHYSGVSDNRDFSRFSEERPLPHVVHFEPVTLSVVTPLCAFGALDEVRLTNFRALKIGTGPVHGLIMGSQKKYFASDHRIAMIR